MAQSEESHPPSPRTASDSVPRGERVSSLAYGSLSDETGDAGLFDTHCHLNDVEGFPDPAGAISTAREAGVTKLAVVGVNPENCYQAIKLAGDHEGVFAIVGHHPNYTATYNSHWLEELRTLLEHPKVVALGEIGLDNHWDYATPDQQRKALQEQFDLAVELNKPTVFHVREAYDEFLVWLELQPKHPSCCCHCFGGTAHHARALAELGVWIGIDGPVTYKRSTELREILTWYPRELVVLETDSPYLSPEPHRGTPNSPARIPIINAALAKIWDVSEAESASQTTANAHAFFRLEAR